MGLEPGYHVSKYVRLVRMLRYGGMGSVWVAEHTALDTHVAVKFISGEYADDPSLVTRFKREATSAAQIKSPHVVQIHDHGVTADGEPFIVMELLEGEDLGVRLKRGRKLPLQDVAVIVLQTCRVLAKAHRIDIIHRDIKPSNIFLVDTDGELFIKLLDFGVAKMGAEADELTTTGAMVGTMGFMSPEQLMNARRVDHRADLWSLAVVAYRALTGTLPFKDEDGIGAFCRALDLGTFVRASELVPGIPPAVDDFFDRAFRRDPAERFAAAREMADEFLVAAGEPSLVMPPSTSRAPAVSGDHEAPSSSTAGAAGNRSRATSGNRSRATSGNRSRATSGNRSHADAPSSMGGQPALTAPPERTLSAAGVARTPAGEADADSAASPGRAADPTTSGAASARTLAGTEAASGPAPKGKSRLRPTLLALLTLGVLAGGALAGARFLYPDRFRLPLLAPPITGDRPPPSAHEAPQAPEAPEAPPSAPVVAVTPSASADPPAPSATGSASAAPSTAPAPSVSARPSSSVPSGGKGRPRTNKPEKDYGF